MIKIIPILLTIILITSIPSIYSQSVDDARSYLEYVFLRLREAEGLGANVRDEALMLNEALNLIRLAESNSSTESLSKALSIINMVNNSIPKLVEEGLFRARMNQIILATTISLTIIASILIYFYGPRVLWSLWIRARGNWRVRRT
ncbi:MAG: hypothetical protein QW803_03855 [Candidatus Methanomethylicia archaeon]